MVGASITRTQEKQGDEGIWCAFLSALLWIRSMFLSNLPYGPQLSHFSCRRLLEGVKPNQWMDVLQLLMRIQTKATLE